MRLSTRLSLPEQSNPAARTNDGPDSSKAASSHVLSTTLPNVSSTGKFSPESLHLVAGRNFDLVRRESGEDFAFFACRHLGEVEAAPQLGRHFVEFSRR